MNKVIPPNDEYQLRQKYPDNATFCPDGRNWRHALGIFGPERLRASCSFFCSFFTKNELIVKSIPDKVSIALDGQLKGRTPIKLKNILPGKHTITLTQSGFVITEYEVQILDRRREEVLIGLKKADPREILINSIVEEIWNKKWGRQLEKSIDEFKIFWDIPFRRFVQLELGTEELRKIGKRMKLNGPAKWIYQNAVIKIIDVAIRKIAKTNHFLKKFDEAVTSLNRLLNCEICGRKFRPLDTHERFFEASNGGVRCCRSCISQCLWACSNNLTPPNPFKTKYKRKDMLKDLKNLFELTKSIPPANLDLSAYQFFRSIPDENRSKAFLQVYMMRPYSDYIKMFGSWFKALVESGILSDGALRTGRGIRCLALDKHECLSLLERQVDDWLFMNGIKHIIEPKYPKHKLFNPNENIRADFLVKNIFIEIWGLKGTKTYDEKIEIKKKLAKEAGIQLIEINPEDFVDLDKKLKFFQK